MTDIWQSAVFWCHIKQTAESFDCGVVVVEVKQCIRIIILIYIKREKNIGKTSAGLFALISPHLPRHQLFCFQHGHLTTTKTISSTGVATSTTFLVNFGTKDKNIFSAEQTTVCATFCIHLIIEAGILEIELSHPNS